MGGVIGGLSNVFGDYSDKTAVEQGIRKFLGVFQLLGGVAALKTAQYLVMPWKLISDIKGINSIFEKTAKTSEEIKASNKARFKGYKDSKTGVIYSEDEYNKMKKSARELMQNVVRRAGKGISLTYMEKSLIKDFKVCMEIKEKLD